MPQNILQRANKSQYILTSMDTMLKHVKLLTYHVKIWIVNVAKMTARQPYQIKCQLTNHSMCNKCEWRL
jgi:hypothetical protein